MDFSFSFMPDTSCLGKRLARSADFLLDSVDHDPFPLGWNHSERLVHWQYTTDRQGNERGEWENHRLIVENNKLYAAFIHVKIIL